MIPFIDLKTQYQALKPEIDRGIQGVLDHGQYIMGPEVAELEVALAAHVGVPHCISAASGTEALLMSLMALGIGPGDEVVTTPFSFAATAEVIVLAGATPVFADIEPDTCNLDAESLAAAIGPATRAIMPVGLYGQTADMDRINADAADHGLAVIEDAAQSFGATYDGRQSCALSTLGCTSFFPSKPLGCYGDGGAVFTADDELATACREIRVHGQSKRYHHTRVGLGGRMDTLQCAVLLAKLPRFGWEIERRLAIGARYNALFDARGIERVVQRSGRTSAFAQYTVMVDERPVVQARLKELGVPTAVHYPATLPAQPAYGPLSRGGPTPIADRAADRVMSLPMHPDLDEATQDRVVAALAEVLGR